MSIDKNSKQLDELLAALKARANLSPAQEQELHERTLALLKETAVNAPAPRNPVKPEGPTCCCGHLSTAHTTARSSIGFGWERSCPVLGCGCFIYLG